MLRWVRCTQEGDVPSARDSHNATVYNGQVFMFGGQDASEETLDDFYMATLRQRVVLRRHVDEAGNEIEFNDREFTLLWH